MIRDIIIIMGLIFLSGCFSLLEMALISVKKNKIERFAKEHKKGAINTLYLIQHPNIFLSTIQICITVIGIILGLFSDEGLARYLALHIAKIPFLATVADTLSIIIIVTLVSAVTIIFGELAPKRVGMKNAEAIAMNTSSFMVFFSKLLHPFVWILSACTQFALKVACINSEEKNKVTEEEIIDIINEGTEQGTIEEAEQKIIERVFDLDDRNVTSLMTHASDIVWLDRKDDRKKILQKINATPHNIYPVCEGNLNNLKGIVSIKFIMCNDEKFKLSKVIMPAILVPEANTLYHVLEVFKKNHQKACFVIDEYGTVQGMITLTDLMEALVGDIPSEPNEIAEIIERKDGTYLIDAKMAFYDFLTHFGKDTEQIGENEFDTLAGFILHQLKHIPKEGELLEWEDFLFEIADMDAMRIDKIIVKNNKPRV
ncbi:MAG: hemolysin family protein [Chitinophagaceae bacterium]